MTQKIDFLSKNQQIVLEIIEKAKEPLKAYSILFSVQKKELKHPHKYIERLID